LRVGKEYEAIFIQSLEQHGTRCDIAPAVAGCQHHCSRFRLTGHPRLLEALVELSDDFLRQAHFRLHSALDSASPDFASPDFASIKRFIFASSGAPVGERQPPIHEELAARPVSPYGASKLSGEGYCSAYYRTYGLETVALRFGNVYGPGSDQKSSVIAKFIKQAIGGETLQIYGDGEQTRDFIFIDDLVHVIRLAVSVDSIGGEIFQIGTNTERTVTEVVQRLLPILTQAGITDVRVRHVSPRKGDVRRNFSDTSKARKLLGWQAQMKLETGLKRTWEWFSRLNV